MINALEGPAAAFSAPLAVCVCLTAPQKIVPALVPLHSGDHTHNYVSSPTLRNSRLPCPSYSHRSYAPIGHPAVPLAPDAAPTMPSRAPALWPGAPKERGRRAKSAVAAQSTAAYSPSTHIRRRHCKPETHRQPPPLVERQHPHVTRRQLPRQLSLRLSHQLALQCHRHQSPPLANRQQAHSGFHSCRTL